MPPSFVSNRAQSIAAVESFRLLWSYLEEIDYLGRPASAGYCDFTFGDPREVAPREYVEALRDAAIPQNESWFAYQMYQEEAQQAAAASLGRLTGIPFAAPDILLTTGGFAAIGAAMKVIAEPGDEVIYCLPPWFFYEPLAVEAALVPVKVRIDAETLDLDIDAIASAITPRTRLVIVNSPNNPTGRIYSSEQLRQLAAVLDDASDRIGHRIFIVSDEPYNRIVFDGSAFHTPAASYPFTLIAYSYGKTLLSPGQRLGYLALPPTLPDREALRAAVQRLQMATTWTFPNAIMQYALPALEQQSIDVAHLQRRRDFMVDALLTMGYRVNRPQGTFYLFPRSPIADDVAFTRRLAEHGILALPGAVFETPGFFRLCLTATDDVCERALPGFARGIGG